jgi:hypothetical protein
MDDGRRFAAKFQHAGHHVCARRGGDGDPGGTEPVNTIWLTPDARQRRAGLMAQPAETLTAPFGRPTASAARANQALVSGSSSGVLITQALPVAKRCRQRSRGHLQG